jgi:hypothetical protein
MESIILDAGFHTSAVKFGLAFGMDRTRGLAQRDNLPQSPHDLVFGVGGHRQAVLDVQAVQLSERVSKSNTA